MLTDGRTDNGRPMDGRKHIASAGDSSMAEATRHETTDILWPFYVSSALPTVILFVYLLRRR